MRIILLDMSFYKLNLTDLFAFGLEVNRGKITLHPSVFPVEKSKVNCFFCKTPVK